MFAGQRNLALRFSRGLLQPYGAVTVGGWILLSTLDVRSFLFRAVIKDLGRHERSIMQLRYIFVLYRLYIVGMRL